MRIIYVAMACLNNFQEVDSNKYILKTLIEINTATIALRVCFRI